MRIYHEFGDVDRRRARVHDTSVARARDTWLWKHSSKKLCCVVQRRANPRVQSTPSGTQIRRCASRLTDGSCRWCAQRSRAARGSNAALGSTVTEPGIVRHRMGTSRAANPAGDVRSTGRHTHVDRGRKRSSVRGHPIPPLDNPFLRIDLLLSGAIWLSVTTPNYPFLSRRSR